MDKRQEEFLARLRGMFRSESAEHLASMTQALAGMQREPGSPGAALERLFREAHTLKGAARSASLPEVEALCQALESLIADVKRNPSTPPPELFECVQSALDVLGIWCDTPGAAPTSAG